MKAIDDRRSIRKFTDAPIPEDVILELVDAAAKAPSSKNRQPWKFVVVEGGAKAEMLHAFRQGLEREETGCALLPASRQHLASARRTADIMEQAPVSIFIMNPLEENVFSPIAGELRVSETANVQSVGAAVQNLLLCACEKGLGSLWICDIFFAYEELTRWLAVPGELIAAVALGFPAEAPPPRPRKALSDIVLFRR